MLQKIIKSGVTSVESKVRSLPRQFKVADFFSGAGSFYKITQATMNAFERILPEAAEDLEVTLKTENGNMVMVSGQVT